ncbi:MAG: glycosyltransferase [Pyrinomonadaceae bacterium]|nr:glycosyltransferase [Phycisphaerales bacterium]
MIDPRKPDYTNTPSSPGRPGFGYVPGHVRDGAVPAATIITPFFNTGEVFHETAACVRDQSLQNFEWLIIDDGSTDPVALAILQQYSGVDPRVRIIHHEQNRGLSAARNTGFASARSECVFMLDSDDLIEPTTLEKCLWYLHTHPEASFVKGCTVGFAAQEYLWNKGFHDGSAFLKENLVTATAMVRRATWERCGGAGEGGGGFDESIRKGMEDWDFWLRAASNGHWGATIPEYLDWYRRRAPVGQPAAGPWENLSDAQRMTDFHQSLQQKYPGLYANPFPTAHPRWRMPCEPVSREIPVLNPLPRPTPESAGAGSGKRLLLVAPWLTLGGADKFNLAMVRELTRRGWRVTIATTVQGDHSWMPEFTAITPDVFAMPHFLRMPDFPLFLRYLMESRTPDVVMVSNSELGYLILPYLRAHHPDSTFVDLSHMEESDWKNGGHPRYAAGCQDMLDLNIVVSEHLKRWMVQRGAEDARIAVCYVSTCEEPEVLVRDQAARNRVRDQHGIPDSQPLILYAGRLVQQKQPKVFADVMRRLVDQERQRAALGADGSPSFTCLVAGDGPDMHWLRQFVIEHDLSQRVRLLGAIPQQQMRDLLSASDLFFLPSQWEGIALSIYEAMATGLAVVGADVGGQKELVTPSCGVLIPRSTEDAEARAYAQVLGELLTDPARVIDMGHAGSRRVLEGFVPSVLGDRLEEIFDAARQLRIRAPRKFVSREFGREVAGQGVEYLRAFMLAESLWHERDRLWQERDQLRHERDVARTMTAPIIQYVHPQPDAHMQARQIVESNFRYRAADRVNGLLKTVGLQRVIKTVTVRALGVGKKRN